MTDVDEDPNPTENLAIYVSPTQILDGSADGDLSFAWPGYVTDGVNRTAQIEVDGLPVLREGDQELLFLVPEEDERSPFFGVVSHRPTNSAGVSFVEGGIVTATGEGNGLNEEMADLTIEEIATRIGP